MIPKKFRVWDGEAYWYSNDSLLFQKDFEAKYLHEAITNKYFTLNDFEQFIGKIDCNGVQIYENDVIYNPMLDPEKMFQVIWDIQDCSFRKIPLGQDLPITKIDEAFMEVKGTIRGY